MERETPVRNRSRHRAVVATLLVACSMAGCRPGAETTAPTGETVEVARVSAADMERAIDVPVSVEPWQQAKLQPRTAGYVARVLVDIGDTVKQGQLLVALDTPELLAAVAQQQEMVKQAAADKESRQAEVEQARSRLAEQQALLQLRQAELRRISTLVGGGALKQERLDEARFAHSSAEAAIKRGEADVDTALAHVKSAEAAVGVARAELQGSEAMASFASIEAPFDGLVTGRMVDPGALVRPGDEAMPLLELADVERLRAVLHLPMDDAVGLDVSDTIVLHSIPSQPETRIEGKIARHAKSFSARARMMRAEIDLDNAPDAETGRRPLKPGDYGKATVTLESHAGITSVPVAAVGGEAGERFVVVVEQQTCRRTPVEIVIADENRAGVKGDIKVGDDVIASDPNRFQEGQQVRVAEAAE